MLLQRHSHEMVDISHSDLELAMDRKTFLNPTSLKDNKLNLVQLSDSFTCDTGDLKTKLTSSEWPDYINDYPMDHPKDQLH